MRKFLLVILPILLPFIIYGCYLLLARRRARLAGEGKLPQWQEAPWTWIVAASFLLLAGGLIAVRFADDIPPGTKVEPPRIELDERSRSLPVQ